MSKGWSCIGHSLIPSSFLLNYLSVLFRNREMYECSISVLHRLSQCLSHAEIPVFLTLICPASQPWPLGVLHVNVFACCLFISLRARPLPSHVVVAKSCPTLARLLSPFPLDLPGKKSGVGCHFLLQEISTQGSNPRQLHWEVDSLPRNLQGSLGAGR